MPVEKEVTKLIPKFYKWNAENLGLFISIKAQQMLVPTIRLDQAILNYFKMVGITVDDWDVDSAKATFNRLQNEFYGK